MANEATTYTNRSFVSFIALVMYAMHTTSYNAAHTFKLMRAYRAVCRNVAGGQDWDGPLQHLDGTVAAALKSLAIKLTKNEWHHIAAERHSTYNEGDYRYII